MRLKTQQGFLRISSYNSSYAFGFHTHYFFFFFPLEFHTRYVILGATTLYPVEQAKSPQSMLPHCLKKLFIELP